jgi:succinoglycan biosynthesis transport protein ExoP
MSVWRTVRKHWVLVSAIALSVTLGVGFYAIGQVKIYKASVSIQIDPNPPRPLGTEVQNVVDMGAGAYWSNKEYYQTQFQIIRSRRVAAETARVLGLNRDAGFLQNLPAGKAGRVPDATIERAADVLRSRLSVDPEKSSRLVVVSIEDADPARAQRIAKTLIDVYTQQNLDDVLTSAGNAGDWLRTQLEKLKVELESNEMALHDYKKTKNILSVSIDDQSNMLRGEMTLLNNDLTGVRTKIEGIAARVAELNKIDSQDPINLPATELLTSNVLTTLRADYMAAKEASSTLAAMGKGAEHPEARAATARVEATRSALIIEVANVKGALEGDLRAARAQAAGLAGLFERAKGQALDLNLLEIEYNRLARSKNNTERLYSLVLERSKESDLTGMMRFNNIRIVDAPVVPRSPIRPNVPASVAVGLLLGLGLGLGAAFGRESMDRTVKSPEDLEREVGFPLLGLLPEIDSAGHSHSPPRRRRGTKRPSSDEPVELTVYREPTSGLAEAARALRTNIIFMSPDKPQRRLLVTSAGPAEGKTTVACCIAIAMAQAGQRVLLVDCDLRRPRLHRVFSRVNDAGVTNVLMDLDMLDRLKLETEIPNLSLLPSGPIAPSPAELLHSDRFGELLAELERRYDRVIIDSPPVVPVTDAAILSKRVDGTVLVVRAFDTRRELARRAVRNLQDVDANVVGTVLNALNPGRGTGYQQYYYYHYYGKSGYASNPPDADTSASDNNAAAS